MNLEGKTFIVTGGGSGLGEASVRAIVAKGGNAIVADVQEDKGKAVAEDLGGQARFAKCDVTSEEDVQGCIDLATKDFGGLHGAVNCAGIGAAMRVVSKAGPHELGLFETIVRVNLIGTFNVIRLAGAVMTQGEADDKGERGVIVNTASVAAYDGQIGQAGYSASKGGVVAMTLPIAREFAKFGVRVVTIAPGLFDTPMFDLLPEDAKTSLGAQVPFPSRLGYPSEFADLVVHIAENTMLNGETIRLDGAVRMQPK